MAKTIGITLKVDGVEQSIKSVNELEETIQSLNEELKQEDIGSARFKKLSGELQNARSELKTFEKTFEGLEPQQKAEAFVKLGEGIAGAFAVGAGALALFGADSEKLAEIQTKVQGAIAISIGVRQLAEARLQGQIALRIAQEKAYQAVQAITTLVVGTSTGALKAFRIALAATGIGLIIIALGALVANWDKLTGAIFGSVSQLDKAKKKLAEVGAETKSSTILLGKYRDVVLDTTRSEEERQTALERLKELGIETNDITLDNEDSLRMLNERVEDSIVLAIQKARVDAVLNLIKEKITDTIKKENQELGENVSWYETLWNGIKSTGNPAFFQYYQAISDVENKTEELNELNEEQNDLMGLLNTEMEKLFKIETKVYTQKRKTAKETKKGNTQKDKEKKLIDELIKSYDRYNRALEVLGQTTAPEVEVLEKLNDKLDKQKQILTGILSPLEEYTNSLTKAEVPSDRFGFYFSTLREELEEGFESLPGDGFITFTEQVLKEASEKGFTKEATDALTKLIKNGYIQVFNLLGGDVELRKLVSKAYADLYADPYNFELQEAYEDSILVAFKKIQGITGELTSEQQRGYEAFEKNLKSLIKATSDIEDEIDAVYEEVSKVQDKVNQNLEEGSRERLTIVEDNYRTFYDTINGFDQEYTSDYEKSLREQNLAAFKKMKEEIKIANISQDEREKLLKEYEKMYIQTEENISDKVNQSAKDRFQEQSEGLTNFLNTAAQVATDIANLVNDLTNIQLDYLDALFDKRFEKLDEEYQNDLTKAGDNVRAKNRIDKKYQKERLELEKEYEAEKKKLKKKALIADLLANSLQIIAQTAMNVVKVFPNPFLMALAGVIGAAQLGIAVAQYNAARKLRRGGILDGPRHAQGGIMMGDGSEAEGGEIVLTRGVAQNRQALALANQANLLGGGDNLISQTGRFDNEAFEDSQTGTINPIPIIQTYVVAEEVQRENVISKRIADRSKL